MSRRLTRRELLKAGLTTAMVGAAGLPLPVLCVSCHVPTTDAPNLVENHFRR